MNHDIKMIDYSGRIGGVLLDGSYLDSEEGGQIRKKYRRLIQALNELHVKADFKVHQEGRDKLKQRLQEVLDVKGLDAK